MALELELETYQRKLPELLEHEGKFVLIRGEEVAGVWKTEERALAAAYKRFGPRVPFLVKKIQAVETPEFMRYDIALFPNAAPDRSARKKPGNP